MPYVVSPHGMLDPGSLGRRGVRKRAYAAVVEWPHLRRAAGMIYTAEEERRLAESSVSGLPPGSVVPLGAGDPPDEPRADLAATFFESFPELKGKRVVLFLGRLHEKKGPDRLIAAFPEVRRAVPGAALALVGPGEERYVAGLRAAAGEGVHFLGSLSGRLKWAAYAAADVFVLPSFQENFALTVAEALRVGTPAVLTRHVNIWGGRDRGRRRGGVRDRTGVDRRGGDGAADGRRPPGRRRGRGGAAGGRPVHLARRGPGSAGGV